MATALALATVCCLASLPAVAQCGTTWQGPATGGLWNTAGNWTGGIPTSSTNVCIDNGNAQHSAVTLNIGGAQAANLTINSDDSLSFNDSTNLTISGSTISNAGNISLNSGGNSTDLILAGSNTVTLSGGGTVTLGNAANNRIYSQSNGTLINQETIQGAGQIGLGQTTISNSGTIDANDSTALTVYTGAGGGTNTGTLEATSGGTLVLYGTAWTNTGGLIQATGTNSAVLLNAGTSITGGTLTTSGGGVIETTNAGGTLNGVTISTGSNVAVPDAQSLTLQGTITNNGTIALNSGGNNTNLIMAGNGTVTLTGTGIVSMGNGSENNRIYSANNGTLVNQETIQGAGQIGVGQTTITNSGTIDANFSAGSNILYISPGSGGVTNTGTMEATNGGRLDLTGTYTNTGGNMTASGTGSLITLDNASITGGNLSTSSSGTIETINNATLNGITFGTGTNFVNPDNTSTTLKGTITNNGTISLNSGGNNTNLVISGPVTLSGTGSVNLGNNFNNRIYSGAGGETLTIDQLIQGAGQVGVGQTTFVNNNTIDANFNGSNLQVQAGSGGFTNNGTLEATNGGVLTLYNTAFTNTGATIEALNATNPSTVSINGSTINGGTLTTTGNGVISTVNGSTLSGVTLSSGTNLVLPDNNSLILKGTITNNGTISENSGGNTTNLEISGNVTLAGSGSINLDSNFNNRIYSAGGGDTLTIKQLIQGAGQLGVGQTNFVNNSKVNANFTGSTLQIQAGSGGFTNTGGLLEATNGATLSLYSTTFTNTGGTIEALNATSASTVNLNAVIVNGGTLTTTGNGVINAFANTTLNGLTLSSGSNLVLPDNNNITLKGTITNNGTISENSGGNTTNLLISGPVTLTGTGTVTLSNNANNRIYAPNGSDILTVKQTIQGAGQLGVGLTKIINSKTIDADYSGGTLTINPNSAGVANNGGTLEATNGGILNLVGKFTNNSTGKIEAMTGSTVQINQADVIGGTLTSVGTGGFNVFNGSTLNGITLSSGSNLTMLDNSTTTLIGTITDNGTMNLSSGGNTTNLLLSGNVTLAGTGTLNLSNNINNRFYDPSGAHTLTNNITIQGSGQLGLGLTGVVNNGTIDANGSGGIQLNTNSTGLTNNGTLQVGSGDSMHVFGGPFSNYSSGTLSGGSYNSAGTLEIDAIGTAGGEITNLHNANVTLNGASASFVDAGGHSVLTNLNTIDSTSSFSVLGGSNFTTAGNFTNNGTLTVGSGTNFVVNGNLTNFSGTTLTGGTYNVGGTLQFNGANIVTDSANITLTAAGAQIVDQSAHNALANLATVSSGASFGVTGGANFTTAGNFTNNGTLTTGSGSKFVVNGNLTNFSGNTLTGGTYNVGGTLQFNGASIVNNAAAINISSTTGKIVDQTAHNALSGFNNNTSTGSFTLSGNATFTTAGAFSNAGVLDVSTGSTFTLGNKSTYTQTGGETILDGKMTATSPGTFAINGGSIFGNGGTFTGALTSDGTFNIGDALMRAGKMTVSGTYAQGSTGNLNIDIGGTTPGTLYDQLKVTKAATLGGALNLDLINTFTPKLGAVFTIMNYMSETGTFSSITGTSINSNEHFNVVINPTSVQLDVVSGPSVANSVAVFGTGNLVSPGAAATPEPSSLLLMGGGLLAAVAAYRRKWRMR